MWARLSVFAGGFELDAAEGICADHRLPAGQMLDLLAALADKSVLITEHREGVARYRLPETLREFGQERLQECGEHTTLRRRHRDWHEQLARQADTDWLSPRAAALAARLFREHANVAAAQDFCQAEPGEAEAGLRIALHVWLFYYWDPGHVSAGRYRLSQALAQAREPTVWRARGLLLAGFLAAVGGDRDAAWSLLEQGSGLARQLDDPATRAFAAWAAGHVCLFAGDLPRAIAHCEDGLAVLPADAVRGRLRARLLICLAQAAGLAGDEQRAVECHRELVALTEAGGEYIRRGYSAWSLWALGLAAWRRGDLDQATGLQQQSLRLRSRRNNRMGPAFCVEVLAWIAASRHQYERAAVLLGVAIGLWQSMGVSLDSHQPMAGHHRDFERQARQAMGETAFQAAYHRGLDLPADDAVGYACSSRHRRARRRPGRARHAGTGRTRTRGGADAAGAAGGLAGRRGPQQQGNRSRAGDLAADRRKPHGAHPHQAQLHLPGPGRRLGRVTTGRWRPLSCSRAQGQAVSAVPRQQVVLRVRAGFLGAYPPVMSHSCGVPPRPSAAAAERRCARGSPCWGRFGRLPTTSSARGDPKVRCAAWRRDRLRRRGC